MDELAAVMAAYFPLGRKVTARELPGGNINRGFLLDDGANSLVAQRLNPAVFTKPDQVVENFITLSKHLRGQGFLVAEPVATVSGESRFLAADGAYWRAQTYIAQHTPDAPARPASMGQILARFHRFTADLPPRSLPPTIAGFHDTAACLRAADHALAQAPETGAEQAELRWCRRIIARFRPLADYFSGPTANNRQITHGDPKRENFIRDENGQVLGLFDLDTTASGILAHDLGDCLRSLANPAGEDADLTAVRFDFDICRTFMVGYCHEYAASGTTMPPLAVFAGTLVIAFELGLRRLTDHLLGDRYFRVPHHGDNLRLAMVQFRLAELIAEDEKRLRALDAL
ncbi:MAG: aminoglycoside phosphotransferase family protein [Desulfobulbaceae bacterium]|jgi:Ser/Thr protein kinase RdoA (MazF antagonist)|nr:aminoglycoside phosphotransferase family protein [Desulfobulbaceae bacterium]